MKKEKFTAPAALVTALLTILLFRSLYNLGMNQTVHLDHVTVGYVCEGDEAVIFGDGSYDKAPEIEALADAAGTVNYEICCIIGCIIRG